MSTPVAVGLRVVADLANDDLGSIERQVVERLVEVLAVGVCPESAIGCQNFFLPFLVTAKMRCVGRALVASVVMLLSFRL